MHCWGTQKSDFFTGNVAFLQRSVRSMNKLTASLAPTGDGLRSIDRARPPHPNPLPVGEREPTADVAALNPGFCLGLIGVFCLKPPRQALRVRHRALFERVPGRVT